MDNIPAGQTDDILRRVDGLGCAAAVYSTRKHSGYAPRLRVIIPVDRTGTADEYEPAARKLAALIGIEFCDPTTFEASRLMYWPSCCSDSQYVAEVYDKPFCSLDGVIGMYGDWRDISQWPQVPGRMQSSAGGWQNRKIRCLSAVLLAPFAGRIPSHRRWKSSFRGCTRKLRCRGDTPTTGGSTVGGAVVYDGDLFLYSHHATDPCSGQLVNAFDLVRLHMFGDKDNDAKDGTPAAKLPSFVLMSRLAQDDKPVSELLSKERYEQARSAFETPATGTEASVPDYDLSWLSKLTKDGNGRYEKTINNAVIVLENDPLLKGRIVTDEFASCGMVLGRVPWTRGTKNGAGRTWMTRAFTDT